MSTSNCYGENVLDPYGADPTGGRDSTQAFLDAIRTLGSQGGTIIIPPGRYRIDGAPIRIHTPLRFQGASGSPRTGRQPNGEVFEGSVTTLVFPAEKDGFIVEPDAQNVRFENLALVRDGLGFARRGIHAKRPIYADNLYLTRWERGIDLDGRATHPEAPQEAGYNVNTFRVERIFAEDCRWGTYTHGYDAQGGHFLHIYCFQCDAGIYDSSLGGNGYLDCYVEQAATATGVPYYIDNQSVLLNCRCESALPPQLAATVQAVGGGFGVKALPEQVMLKLGIAPPPFRAINGVPARIESLPFSDSNFVGGEQISITVDGEVIQIVFKNSDRSPEQIAKRINAVIPPGLPPVAEANSFTGSLTIKGWRGHLTGLVSIKEAGATNVLTQIGFPSAGSSANALGKIQLLSHNEISGAVFRAYSDPSGAFGTSEQVEVQVAPRGDVALLWQARGIDKDDCELSVMRLRDATAQVHRWAFARASAGSLTSLAFTMNKDALGMDQVVMPHGVWLQASLGQPAILLCNGVPDAAQGREGDIAWNMATNPQTHYVRGKSGWTAA